MGALDLLMKQMGVDPSAMQKTVEGMQTFSLQVADALKRIMAVQAAQQVQLDRIEKALDGLALQMENSHV